MTEMLELARTLAQLGPVLPVKGKIPLWPEWQKRASQHVNGDPEWKGATGVGLLTGKRAGYFVLDVDGADGAETLGAWEREHGKLPISWTARTGSGGLHFFFRCPDFEVHGSARKLGLGIDVRGERGQVLGAGSRHPLKGPDKKRAAQACSACEAVGPGWHRETCDRARYAWETGAAPGEVQLVDAPGWLLEMLRPAAAPTKREVLSASSARDRAYGLAALRSATEKIAGASEGARNDTLNREAFGVAQLVAGGLLDRATAEAAIEKVAEDCGLPVHEVRATLRSAFGAGERSPRSAPDQRQPPAGAAAVPHSAPLFVPVDDFFASCGERVEYIHEPYVPRDAFVIVGGAPKNGKTWFLGWLAGEISAKGCTVLFVEEEGSKETLRSRLEPFKRPGARIHVSHRKGWKLDDDRSVNRLIEEARAVDAGLLILDPLNQLHAHTRKPGEIPGEVIQAIQRIIRETGCSIVLAAHTRKGESWDKSSDTETQSVEIAGSLGYTASADNILNIKAVPNEERRAGEVRFYVENPDTRNGEPTPRRLAVVRVDAVGDQSALVWAEVESREAKALKRILPHVPTSAMDAKSTAELLAVAGIGSSLGRSAVAFGLETGALVRRTKGGGIYRVGNVGPDERSDRSPSPVGPSDSSPIGESGGRGAAIANVCKGGAR